MRSGEQLGETGSKIDLQWEPENSGIGKRVLDSD